MRRVRQLLRLRGFQGAVPRVGHVDRLGLVTAWAMPPLDQPRGGGCEWPGGFAGLLSGLLAACRALGLLCPNPFKALAERPLA